MPERFDLKYVGADNAEHRPVVIHRAIFGSFERFIAILIEHYRRGVPAVAGAGAGDRAADRRPARGLRAAVRDGWRRPGSASSSTPAGEDWI
jgi:threonyl-tRNA synthetase